MVHPLHIRGARIWNGRKAVDRDLFTDGERFSAERHPNAQTVDLEGCTLYPGMVNAHDHLELNHYPRSKFREVHDNAHQWGDDMNTRLNEEPYCSLRAYPLEDRCFIGGLKNLLCGATTVIHHNPPHRCLFRHDFPVWVYRHYGWAHSLHFSSAQEIRDSFRRTPADGLWFIHLAEGTDSVAASEYQRLKALGCISPKTVLIHGVGLTTADIADAASRVRALVICPTTNRYLLNAIANIKAWVDAGGKYAIGSDSRLTSASDLTQEFLAAKHELYGQGLIDDRGLEPNLLAAKPFMPGSAADFFIPTNPGWNRKSTALVVKGGIPQIGDPSVMRKFTHIRTVEAQLDGKPKAIHRSLAQRVHHCRLKESGLEVGALPKGKWFSFIWQRA